MSGDLKENSLPCKNKSNAHFILRAHLSKLHETQLGTTPDHGAGDPALAVTWLARSCLLGRI